MAFGAEQRHAGIEARTQAEQAAPLRITGCWSRSCDDERFVRRVDRVAAQGARAVQLRLVDADARLEPQAVVVDQGDRAPPACRTA